VINALLCFGYRSSVPMENCSASSHSPNRNIICTDHNTCRVPFKSQLNSTLWSSIPPQLTTASQIRIANVNSNTLMINNAGVVLELPGKSVSQSTSSALAIPDVKILPYVLLHFAFYNFNGCSGVHK
jgi:hypothetical protein